MLSYKIDTGTGSLKPLSRYSFKSEGKHLISPQVLLTKNPRIILDLPELELQAFENQIVAREYSTTRGPIDLLIITSNADIVIVETKLLRNPESHRTVVAQTIDYAKAFYGLNVKELFERLTNCITVDQELLSVLRQDDFWSATLERSINTGNFQLMILGDKIHPNVLGMVESIQSAPHMAFTIFLAELDPFVDSDDNLFITPRVVAKTLEIERSVIKIYIDHEKKEHAIESEIPEEDGRGTKPIITSEQFLVNLTKSEFRDLIKKFWRDWQEVGGDINFGTVGFSAGINQGERRIALFYVLPDHIDKISEKVRENYEISDEMYQQYKEDLKKSQSIYDRYAIGNKVQIPYDNITKEDLEIIFDASINLAKKLKNP